MCTGPTRADGLPTYARCKGCDGSIARSTHPPGSGQRERGPDTRGSWYGRSNTRRCSETESGKHEPRDGSFF